jgi:hypothetical protein
MQLRGMVGETGKQNWTLKPIPNKILRFSIHPDSLMQHQCTGFTQEEDCIFGMAILFAH